MAKSMKLVKHLANLGYGSRKEVAWLFREGRVTDAAGEVLYADDPLEHEADARLGDFAAERRLEVVAAGEKPGDARDARGVGLRSARRP